MTVTVEEAIRQHKAGARRVGQGKPFNVPEDVEALYKAAYLERIYGYDSLSDEDKALLIAARKEA